MAAMPRRQFVHSLLLGTIAAPAAAFAEDSKVWMSGKSDPIRKTNKEKSADGTKKDNKYLGCLNDCVPRKQGPSGPNQLERADCLDACQQECCFTYEQWCELKCSSNHNHSRFLLRNVPH